MLSSRCYLRKVEISKWYFDSACSRHITESQRDMSIVIKQDLGEVVFGDGSTARIRGIGAIDGKSTPQLMNVHIVEGLKLNLISVS